jgi:hypothetical protein
MRAIESGLHIHTEAYRDLLIRFSVIHNNEYNKLQRFNHENKEKYKVIKISDLLRGVFLLLIFGCISSIFILLLEIFYITNTKKNNISLFNGRTI